MRAQAQLRDWATDLVEFVAIGTAVRSERYDFGREPLLCNLSGQDVAKLISHGFWPVGIVGGSTVAYVVTGLAADAPRRWGVLLDGAIRSFPTTRKASTTPARSRWSD